MSLTSKDCPGNRATKKERLLTMLQTTEGFTVEQIAFAAGCSTRTVYRARADLRTLRNRNRLAEVSQWCIDLSGRLTDLERRLTQIEAANLR